jgi:hypothetical protein
MELKNNQTAIIPEALGDEKISVDIKSQYMKRSELPDLI